MTDREQKGQFRVEGARIIKLWTNRTCFYQKVNVPLSSRFRSNFRRTKRASSTYQRMRRLQVDQRWSPQSQAELSFPQILAHFSHYPKDACKIILRPLCRYYASFCRQNKKGSHLKANPCLIFNFILTQFTNNLALGSCAELSLCSVA